MPVAYELVISGMLIVTALAGGLTSVQSPVRQCFAESHASAQAPSCLVTWRRYQDPVAAVQGPH